MTTENTVLKTIAALYKAGTESRDDLILGVYQKHADIGLNKATKAVADWMKAEGLTVARQGVNAAFDEWVLAGCESGKPRSAADVSAYIKDEGTPNMERHKTHYQRIAELAKRAFEKGQAS